MSDAIPKQHPLAIDDWIRFRQDGRLVIAQIEYITSRASWDSTPVYVTQEGVVEADQVLERRGSR